MSDRTRKDWWKNAVFYQVYPRSFQDTNGDGIGDLPGVIRHLDYLKKLGVDGIWLSPFYPSPMKDNGYDITDYCGVDPVFGTIADFDRLVEEATKRDMILMLDLVMNHTSSEHPWFIEATKSRDNPYHDFYIWRDGDENNPPDAIDAQFGGQCWTYVPHLGQYYFNNFSKYQPDLNWENQEVREKLYEMIRFWVNRGAGGFRLDAIEYISKDLANKQLSSGPRLHMYLKDLRKNAFPEPAMVTVGEAWFATLEEAQDYTNPDGSELSMIFQFSMMLVGYGDEGLYGNKWAKSTLNLPAVKACYEEWQTGLEGKGWLGLAVSNHDLPRIVSHWGDKGEYRVQSAKMLAAMNHGLQGTPYIYQGEEIGMTNIELPIEEYDDIEIRSFYESEKQKGTPEKEIMEAIYEHGRDNSRTPMQWTDGKNAGFTDGHPWMHINPDYREVNVEKALADKDSIFYFYQNLIRLRKKYSVFRDGSFTLLDKDNPNTFCYTRDTEKEHLLVECNFTALEQPCVEPELFSEARVIAQNYDDPHGSLKPFETRMLYVKRS